jgi:hypothetical protein
VLRYEKVVEDIQTSLNGLSNLLEQLDTTNISLVYSIIDLKQSETNEPDDAR